MPGYSGYFAGAFAEGFRNSLETYYKIKQAREELDLKQKEAKRLEKEQNQKILESIEKNYMFSKTGTPGTPATPESKVTVPTAPGISLPPNLRVTQAINTTLPGAPAEKIGQIPSVQFNPKPAFPARPAVPAVPDRPLTPSEIAAARQSVLDTGRPPEGVGTKPASSASYSFNPVTGEYTFRGELPKGAKVEKTAVPKTEKPTYLMNEVTGTITDPSTGKEFSKTNPLPASFNVIKFDPTKATRLTNLSKSDPEFQRLTSTAKLLESKYKQTGEDVDLAGFQDAAEKVKDYVNKKYPDNPYQSYEETWTGLTIAGLKIPLTGKTEITPKTPGGKPMPARPGGKIETKDAYGYTIGETKVVNGKTYKYTGNNKWDEQ